MGSDNGSNALPYGWYFLVPRFSRFLDNLNLTDLQLTDGWVKQAGVRAALNRAYWNTSSETENGFICGSWGKTLQVRPPRDVDLLFMLPWADYTRFEQRSGNRQSQLLQEVRSTLQDTYPITELRGDGQVVVVQFATTTVDVIPAFSVGDGRYLICDTRNGGSYILTAPHAEIFELDASDTRNGGATRRLIRMAKQWQRYCDVPIKSIQLERLAIEFLDQWVYSRDLFWVDWMLKDFFAYLVSRVDGVIVMPGTGSVVPLGSEWRVKAETAQANAARAYAYEHENEDILAGITWQDIFGTMISISGR